MTCGTCGEKPKKCGNCNKDFTKAVIEIDNPETLVLLRKVVIPASMGTEEQVPAAIGKYHNVILYYEANSHVYLYSSDGIPTMLSHGEINLDYFTTEIDTHTKWIDGKTIYKKTIAFGSLPDRGVEKTMPHSITNLDVVVKADGFFKNYSDGNYYPLPHCQGSSNITYYITPTVLAVRSGVTGYTNSSAYLTIYYTKS